MTNDQWKFTKQEILDKLKLYCISIREVRQSPGYEHGGGMQFKIAVDEIHFQKKKINRRLDELRKDFGCTEEELKAIDPIIKDIIEDDFEY